ncbi:MAG: hypothetical protein CSA75_00820 [Sorangium cellulosum]|nr:MAG: hypothetical protein CSA75_00820 [Sorangium cellulosum]
MIPDDEDELVDEEEREAATRKFVERLLPELLKRFVDAGVGKLSEQPDNLRHFVQELKVPKEMANYLFSQIDDTKNGLYRVVAREIRDFLEQTNVADEVTKALTKLSFEIKTEIRFVPNDSAQGRFPKPDIHSDVTVKEGSKRKKLAQKSGDRRNKRKQ